MQRILGFKEKERVAKALVVNVVGFICIAFTMFLVSATTHCYQFLVCNSISLCSTTVLMLPISTCLLNPMISFFGKESARRGGELGTDLLVF